MQLMKQNKSHLSLNQIESTDQMDKIKQLNKKINLNKNIYLSPDVNGRKMLGDNQMS